MTTLPTRKKKRVVSCCGTKSKKVVVEAVLFSYLNICSLDGSNLTLLTPTLEASVSVSDFMFVLISVLLLFKVQESRPLWHIAVLLPLARRAFLLHTSSKYALSVLGCT